MKNRWILKHRLVSILSIAALSGCAAQVEDGTTDIDVESATASLVQGIDLSMTSVARKWVNGQLVVTTRYKNLGNQTAGAHKVSWYYCTANQKETCTTLLKESDEGTLASSTTRVIVSEYSPFDLPDQPAYLLASVDSQNQVTEALETNNQKIVKIPAKPKSTAKFKTLLLSSPWTVSFPAQGGFDQWSYTFHADGTYEGIFCTDFFPFPQTFGTWKLVIGADSNVHLQLTPSDDEGYLHEDSAIAFGTDGDEMIVKSVAQFVTFQAETPICP